MRRDATGEVGRTAVRDGSALAVGSVVSGVLAYVFFAAVTRTLGSGPSAPVAVLWAWRGFAGAAFTFPLQHWVTRSAVIRAGAPAGRARVAALVVLAGLVAGAVAWLARDDLFRADTAAYPLLVVAVAWGSALVGVTRGVLAGRGRFRSVAASLAVENGLRCAAALALAAAGVTDPAAYAACLLAGYVVAAWPTALVRAPGPATAPAPQPEDGSLAFVAGASLGQLLAQVVLMGGPVVLAAAGGAPAEVTALFAALALFRAPYTLALGLVSSLTGRLTALVVAGQEDALRRFRDVVVLGTLLGVALAAVGGAALGPWLLRLVFGDDVELAGHQTALIAVGSVLALANLVLTVSVLARGHTGGLALAWLVGAVPAVLVLVLAGGDLLDRTCWAFVIVEALTGAVLLVQDRAGSARLVGRQEDR